MSNGKKGGQEGNDNAIKNKPWRDAINRALARYGEGSMDGGLNKLADELIMKCADADLGFLKEMGDRIEGRPAQSLTVGSDPENPLLIQPVRPKITEEEWKKLKLVK